MSGSTWLSDSLGSLGFGTTCHDLIELVTASSGLFELIAFLLLGVGHKLASMFAILLRKGANDASIGDILELVFALCEALDVVTDALACLVFAS
jgi:hypothetical protein